MRPYDRGVVAAARTGMQKGDNPYPRGTSAHSEWNDGYDSAVELNEAIESRLRLGSLAICLP
jgi:hypothetical protein